MNVAFLIICILFFMFTLARSATIGDKIYERVLMNKRLEEIKRMK